MLDWLRYFGLGFFSNRFAREGRNRNFFNFILSFALALVLLFCGLVAAFALPFKAFYKDAPKLRAVVVNLFEDLPLEIREGKLFSGEVVNTFMTADEGGMSEAQGYNIIVDTRPITTFDDFAAYCIAADGTRIEYEAYLALPAAEKENYSFCIDYTPNALVLDDALVERCEAYLGDVTNEDTAKQYEELKKLKESDETAYREGVYTLFVTCYFPDLKRYEPSGSAPLLRTYYKEYVSDKDAKDYLILLDDVLLGNFSTERGVRVTFYGFYSSMQDGRVESGNAERFILSARKASLSAAVTVFLNNLFLYLPMIAVIPLFCALLLWIVSRVRHLKRPYIDQLKIVGAFVWWAALFTSVIVVVCSFFAAADIVNALPIPLLFAIVALRTVVYLLMDKTRGEKQPSTSDMVPPEETDELQG